MGVTSGCGFKEVYRFPHITYPYSSLICFFLQQLPYFLLMKKNVFKYIPAVKSLSRLGGAS